GGDVLKKNKFGGPHTSSVRVQDEPGRSYTSSHSEGLDTRSGAIVVFCFPLWWLSWSDQRREEFAFRRKLAMGAQGSSQRDGKIQEDASASASGGELTAGMKVLQEGTSVLDGKVLLILTPCRI
ncbi:hypothetical protein GOODEAATRI_006069, partial [Goodea atripinnis]